MTTQLELLQTETRWKLDSETKRLGRNGIAEARAVLARAQADSLVIDLRTEADNSNGLAEAA